MPRLLLVDDNPSIHRIAESLLAPTDVELVCVDSAAEALDRLERGERFDVALVDTAMPGMDGWTLLTRLRAMEATARMPIALMAGVLDPVDPAKLAKAPIQGFLKKPIELRELGDRVKALLATPVAPSPSPFTTVPAMSANDLVRKAEDVLPEWRPEAAVMPETAAMPEPIQSVDLDLSVPAEDLLVLTMDDLWPEPASAALPETGFTPDLPDVHLELEELDLDSLQDLAGDPLPMVSPEPSAALEPPVPFDLDSILPEEDEDELVTLSGLEDLEAHPSPAPAVALMPEPEPVPIPEPLSQFTPEPIPVPEPVSTDLPVAAGVAGAAALAGLAAQALLAQDQVPAPPETVAFSLVDPGATAGSAAGGQAPAAPGQVAPPPTSTPFSSAPRTTPDTVSSEQARALVQALLADPVLVDALVKAVVSRMGDQVLREIAWEVMPDLAGRLQG